MVPDNPPESAVGAWTRGYVQVYTGDGKGKTTAALGLCLRAAGAGLRVFLAQFVKGMPYAEHVALARHADLIVVRQFGRGCFIRDAPEQGDIDAARAGLAEELRRWIDGFRQTGAHRGAVDLVEAVRELMAGGEETLRLARDVLAAVLRRERARRADRE